MQGKDAGDGNGVTIPDIYYNFQFERDFPVRTYMKQGRLDEALTACQRIVTFDSSSSERRLIHPRYIYLLATLYGRKGLTAKAEAEYRRLLEVWQDADRDLPEYADTRKRLARLTARLP